MMIPPNKPKLIAKCLFYYEDRPVAKLIQGMFFICIHAFWKEPLRYKFSQNITVYRGALDVAKSIIEEEILTKLNIKHLVKNGVFIEDFGCSTSHNSFPAMEIITQAIHYKHETAEFYVFFNDVASNDFNTIFTSLSPHRSYHAVAVPGDFHGRLLPDSSLHFCYSSWSLHWLRQVPEVVADSASPAWNKGAILYTENRKEDCDAYMDQFSKDMNAFLESRALSLFSWFYASTFGNSHVLYKIILWKIKL
ncbi:hypothetical protein ACS0TY_035234 [Phlomoides rotata]